MFYSGTILKKYMRLHGLHLNDKTRILPVALHLVMSYVFHTSMYILTSVEKCLPH